MALILQIAAIIKYIVSVLWGLFIYYLSVSLDLSIMSLWSMSDLLISVSVALIRIRIRQYMLKSKWVKIMHN